MRQAFWRRGVYSRTATPSARVTPVVTAGPTPHTGKMTALPSGDCGPTFCALEFAPGRSHPGRDVTPDVATGSQTPTPGRLRSFGSTADRGCVGGNSNGCHAQCETRRYLAGTEASADAPYKPVLQLPRERASGFLPRRQLQGSHQSRSSCLSQRRRAAAPPRRYSKAGRVAARPPARRNAEDALGYSTAFTVRFGGVVRRPRSDMAHLRRSRCRPSAGGGFEDVLSRQRLRRLARRTWSSAGQPFVYGCFKDAAGLRVSGEPEARSAGCNTFQSAPQGA